MSSQEREILNLTDDQFEYVEEQDGWELVSSEHYDKRRWYDVWKYVVKNLETGKFYRYFGEVYSGDYDRGGYSEGITELTQVFPHDVTVTVYK